MKRIVPTTCLSLLLAACGGGESEGGFGAPRQVPKSQRPTVWGTSARDRLGLQDMGSPASAGGATEVVAALPPGWEELPANPARFRNAVWRVAGQPDSDCYLTLGVGGGVVGNLTRWYQNQFGVPTPMPESLPYVDFAGRQGRLCEIEGTFSGKPEWAALIAWYNEGDSVTSLKFTGPKSIVAGNREQFLALARSIRLQPGSGADGGATGSGGKAPAVDPSQPMPSDHPPTGAVQTPPPAAQEPPFVVEAPAGWQPKAGSTRPLHHTFGEASEVYVSQLGGALKSSLDIWRGEVGLGPMTDEEFAALPKVLFLGDDALLMDLRGRFQGMTGKQIDDARLLVAARVDGASITFCKLVGPAVEVDAQRDAFLQYCGAVRRTR